MKSSELRSVSELRAAIDDAEYRAEKFRDLARRIADCLEHFHIVGGRERELLREARALIWKPNA